MKKLNNISVISFLTCFFLVGKISIAQNEEKPSLMLNVSHYTSNNSLQYLKVQTQIRANNKIQPVKNVPVQLYLDSVAESNLIGKVWTNEKGSAETNIPSGLKNLWVPSTNHKFIAIAKANPKDEETTTELEIAKAKIEIDTLNEDGTRSVTAKVFSFENGDWVPAKDVEVKIGVKRSGGSSLKIGEDESYTTDSLGQVSGEFKLDSLPTNDLKGNIVLIAKIEDNDQFGNLSIEKTVSWGKYYQHSSGFGQRALWAPRFKSPLWLIFMAYSIVVGVWGTLIYLIVQIFKMKRLGKGSAS